MEGLPLDLIHYISLYLEVRDDYIAFLLTAKFVYRACAVKNKGRRPSIEVCLNYSVAKHLARFGNLETLKCWNDHSIWWRGQYTYGYSTIHGVMISVYERDGICYYFNIEADELVRTGMDIVEITDLLETYDLIVAHSSVMKTQYMKDVVTHEIKMAAINSESLYEATEYIYFNQVGDEKEIYYYPETPKQGFFWSELAFLHHNDHGLIYIPNRQLVDAIRNELRYIQDIVTKRGKVLAKLF